jgi:hypothetical protein
MERERIRQAIEIMWQHPKLDDAGWVDELARAGLGEVEARLLTSVVPEAFAIPMLEESGARPGLDMQVPRRKGGYLKVPVSRWPIFTELLAVAREKASAGPRSVYLSVASRSATMDAINQARARGEDVKGWVLSTTLLGPTVEELGPLLDLAGHPESRSRGGRAPWLLVALGLLVVLLVTIGLRQAGHA